MEGSSLQFVNVEYFFRLLYEGAGYLGTFETFGEWFLHAWGVFGTVSFLFSVLALGVWLYSTIRVKQITDWEDKEKYSTLNPDVAEKAKDHSRWNHIRTLIESASESDWRQAVIEADIMLEEVLNQAGYLGETVADKLKGARFDSLQDAWDAHKVRNDIAHLGSVFHLDDKLAYRTIQKYERVFKEFGEI